MIASGVQTPLTKEPTERLSKLLSELGYDRSPHYLARGRGLEAAPDFGHLYRRAIEGLCQLQGVYVLRPPQAEAASIPVVYVCQADSEEKAQEIHRLVWNQGLVPYLLVVSPRKVRLYSGFQYNRREAEGTDDTPDPRIGLVDVLEDMAAVSKQLADFRADAIDTGRLLAVRGQTLDVSGRVDWKLLDNLKHLAQALIKGGTLSRSVVHALIGKYVYLYYLRDRKILSEQRLERWGIAQEAVFGRKATLEGLSRLMSHLESWLNGQIFPLPLTGPRAPTQGQLQQVAGTFAGDMIYPDGTQQLHLAFDAYDFSYIPIETLSVIYEQFLHADDTPEPTHALAAPDALEDGDAEADNEAHGAAPATSQARLPLERAKKLGAFYTPIPLVNFVLDELDSQTPLTRGMRVLDPACGSGAFLVQCYRRLIERSLRSHEPPQPVALRDLLTEHIFGVDLDEDACRVTAMSLVMTLLDSLDPTELENIPFKLPTLYNTNIIHGNFFDPNLNLLEGSSPLRVHRIVANPPWKTLKRSVLDPHDRPAWAWMQQHDADMPVGDNQVARAFVWKAMDYLIEGGEIGIIIPAMTLFDNPSQPFREKFFRRANVRAIANFSNLTEVLFAGRSRVPAAVFVYSPSTAPANQPEYIPVFSPRVANQELTRPAGPGKRIESWSLAFNASEVRDVSLASVQNGNGLPWKLSAWGSFLDQRLLERVARRFPSLGSLEEAKPLSLSEGPQLRKWNNASPPEDIESVPELVGKNRVDMGALRGLRNLFAFPPEALKRVEDGDHYVRKGRVTLPLSICRPPHVIVSAARTFAIYSDEFLVVPARQIGIISPTADRTFLKALSLYLSSDFAFYHQFLMSAEFGVKRDRATLIALRNLPAPIATQSKHELDEWAVLQEQLAETSRQDFSRSQHTAGSQLLLMAPAGHDRSKEDKLSALVAELNDRVYRSLGMTKRDRCLVQDLVHVKLALNDGKVGHEAVAAPTESELTVYAQMLQDELNAFVGGTTPQRHQVRILPCQEFGVAEIRFELPKPGAESALVIPSDSSQWSELQRLSQQALAGQSQWLIFNRNLRVYRGTTTYLFKPLQRFHWTASQARLDAVDVIAETLAGAGGSA